MSNNLSFKRKFVILKKEYSNMRNLNPKGHGKLELRNNRFNISVNIDNAESDQYYNILLIGDNKAHNLGKIHTDKRYSGKAEFEFNYKDIESIGFPLEKINGILILRDSNILLGASLDKDDKTIKSYIEKLNRTDRPSVSPQVPQEDGPTVAEVDDLAQNQVDIKEPVYVEEQVETEEQINTQEQAEVEATQEIHPPVSEDLPTTLEMPLETDTEILKEEDPIEESAVEEPVTEERYIKNDLFTNDKAIENTETTEDFRHQDELVAQEDIYPVSNSVEAESDDQFIPLDDPTIHQEPIQEITGGNHPPASYMSPAVAVTEEEYHRALQEMFNDSNVDFLEDEVEYIDADTQKKLNQKNQTTNYVLNILSFFPYIEPFKIDLMGYNWWKIEIDDPKEDKGFLPYFSYIAGGNHKYPLVENTVTATALMRKHGHYLFGLYNVNDEVKFYVYGVPGRFTTEDHPQKGTTGFNTWYEGRDNVGYWLLYIDPLTGRIIYPINPMIPKD